MRDVVDRGGFAEEPEKIEDNGKCVEKDKGNKRKYGSQGFSPPRLSYELVFVPVPNGTASTADRMQRALEASSVCVIRGIHKQENLKLGSKDSANREQSKEREPCFLSLLCRGAAYLQ